jgi:hypothetical protein
VMTHLLRWPARREGGHNAAAGEAAGMGPCGTPVLDVMNGGIPGGGVGGAWLDRRGCRGVV